MPALRNIRHHDGLVSADFTLNDGREGSISVPAQAYQAHGDAVLQQEADACERWSRFHGYQSPEADRYSEIR